MPSELEPAATALRLLGTIQPFDRLADTARRRLAAQACERHVVAGEMIVREGDDGDEFYLVAAGSLHVLGRAFDGTDLVLARLEAGSCFGEQALLPADRAPRSASVRAVTRCSLLVLPRAALAEAGASDAGLLDAMRRTGARQTKERGALFRDRVLHDIGLDGSYRIERFAASDYVFRQGEPGDKVYLVLAGRALAIRGDGDAAEVLSELLPGQFFGERAILNDAPRAASVQAVEPLETAALDGAWFRAALAHNPRLRSVMASLQSIYILPARGLVTLQSSSLGSHPSLTAMHHLDDGRRILSTRLVDADAFRAQLIGAPEATFSVRFTDGTTRAHRQVHFFDDRIVEIESDGEWPELGTAFERMLDGRPVGEEERAAFAAGGNLGAAAPPPHDAAELVCRCSGVTAAAIVAAIAGGCHTVEQIAASTRSTVVCGGCIPTVKDFLGQGEWLSVSCDTPRPVAPDTNLFRLRTSRRPASASLPGQHVVLQARIGGRWVERPYTIASPPGDDGSYEIVVRREPNGLLSRWMFDRLENGSALRISAPRGSFCIAPGRAQDVVFFAGGIGITPALAMARSMRRQAGAWSLSIDHSCHGEEEIVFREELTALAQACPRLRYRARVTSREGRLGAADIAAAIANQPAADFYVCGSADYVDAVTVHLRACDVPPPRIVTERFTAIG